MSTSIFQSFQPYLMVFINGQNLLCCHGDSLDVIMWPQRLHLLINTVAWGWKLIKKSQQVQTEWRFFFCVKLPFSTSSMHLHTISYDCGWVGFRFNRHKLKPVLYDLTFEGFTMNICRNVFSLCIHVLHVFIDLQDSNVLLKCSDCHLFSSHSRQETYFIYFFDVKL